MIKIGVIADDFTGATDIASFLVENGLSAVQMNGVPTGELPEDTDTVVISLKTRSCPVTEAIQQSLRLLSGYSGMAVARSTLNTAPPLTAQHRVISDRLPMP